MKNVCAHILFFEGVEKALAIENKIFDKDANGKKMNFDKKIWEKNKNKVYYQKICLEGKCKKVHKHLRRAQVLMVAHTFEEADQSPDKMYKHQNQKYNSSTDNDKNYIRSSSDSDDGDMINLVLSDEEKEPGSENVENESEYFVAKTPVVKNKKLRVSINLFFYYILFK